MVNIESYISQLMELLKARVGSRLLVSIKGLETWVEEQARKGAQEGVRL